GGPRSRGGLQLQPDPPRHEPLRLPLPVERHPQLESPAAPPRCPGEVMTVRGAGATAERRGESTMTKPRCSAFLIVGLLCLVVVPLRAERTQKPPLHAAHWLAITGKPLSATAGAMMFQRGGNAVDAACAMLGAVTTMWDVLAWGGETQALIYDPRAKKVIGIDALGVAPSGATAEYFRSRGYRFPPEYGALAAITPGTPGGLMTMLAEYGTLSLGDVLAPAIQMADGYPIEA